MNPQPLGITSAQSPLRVDLVYEDPSGGKLGISICPGKCDGIKWNRDLDADLDMVEEWGASYLVTLLETDEMSMLRVAALEDEAAKRDIHWVHLPIVDVQPPGQDFDGHWPAASATLAAAIRDGENIVIHCRGGLGRTGTVAAIFLMDLGFANTDAVRLVRAARPAAIETQAQLAYVMNYVPARTTEQ